MLEAFDVKSYRRSCVSGLCRSTKDVARFTELIGKLRVLDQPLQLAELSNVFQTIQAEGESLHPEVWDSIVQLCSSEAGRLAPALVHLDRDLDRREPGNLEPAFLILESEPQRANKFLVVLERTNVSYHAEPVYRFFFPGEGVLDDTFYLFWDGMWGCSRHLCCGFVLWSKPN